MRAIWTRLAPGIATLALALASGSASAQFSSTTCSPSGDFVTGGGFIIIPDPATGAHANFGVAGGCKNGSLWGHLEYVDHGSGLALSLPTPFNVHWISITAYRFTDATTREICGTARTNDSTRSTVGFHVTVQDNDPDTFRIRLFVGSPAPFYETFVNPLSGGNIKIHKPNPSTPTDEGTCPDDVVIPG
jgi:hypothetical protein